MAGKPKLQLLEEQDFLLVKNSKSYEELEGIPYSKEQLTRWGSRLPRLLMGPGPKPSPRLLSHACRYHWNDMTMGLWAPGGCRGCQGRGMQALVASFRHMCWRCFLLSTPASACFIHSSGSRTSGCSSSSGWNGQWRGSSAVGSTGRLRATPMQPAVSSITTGRSGMRLPHVSSQQGP